MPPIFVAVQAAVLTLIGRHRDRGQSTAEYALVLLGAASVALLLLAWAGQTDRLAKLLDAVLDKILANVP